ncbi:MAG: tyrosine-type recombinase/integrase [Jatrophihabitantaceae bacterium]
MWDRYLRSKASLKPSTAAVYKVMWLVHIEPAFGRWPVGRIKHGDVAEWVANLAARRSASTTRHAYRVLSLVLDVAVRERLVPRNEATGVDLPKLTRGHRVVATAEQVEALAILFDGDHGDLVRLLAYTGLRWGEATALRVCDVDIQRRRLHVRRAVVEVDGKLVVGTPKSHHARQVPLAARAMAVVISRVTGRQADELLFPSRTRQPIRNNAFRRATDWAKSTAEVGLAGLRIHDLRHTAASLMISSGADVLQVAKVLGHSSPTITLSVYGHLFKDHLDDVSRRLDDLLNKDT